MELMSTYTACQRKFLQTIRAFYQRLMATILPPSCAVCRTALSSDSEPISICGDCFVALPWWRKDDMPVPSLHNVEGVDGFSAPFLYEDPIRRLIQQFKYEDASEFASALATYMLGDVRSLFAKIAEEELLITPVPMYKSRMWKRQYNQSDLLGRHIAGKLNLEYSTQAILRIKRTSQQQGKTAKQRKKNLKGAFVANSSLVEGRSIVLVDDVWTTGSTASACAQVLKKAGAKEVHVVTVCYVEK